MSAKHTPGPWFVGAQNDALYIVAGRAPAPDNDHPWHEAPRVAVAKVYSPSEGDVLPLDADANARLLASAPEMLEALIAAEIACTSGSKMEESAKARDLIRAVLSKVEAAE